MADCIFCKIIAGDIPCHRVYEDDHVIAFLDVGPIARGHTLVLPKTHVSTLDVMDEKVASALGSALPKVARAVIGAVEVEAFNVLQNNGEIAGQSVHHVHFHVIPKTAENVASGGGSGMSLLWPAGKLGDDAAALAEAIKARLQP